MENYVVILIVLAAVVLVFGGITVAIPYLIKKGINISGLLSGSSSVIQTADCVVDTLQGLFPEVEAFSVIDKVIGWAAKAAEAAEQLYKASQIQAEERKAAATNLVYEFITTAGIDLDDHMKKIVDGAIEAAVFALPKTHANV